MKKILLFTLLSLSLNVSAVDLNFSDIPPLHTFTFEKGIFKDPNPLNHRFLIKLHQSNVTEMKLSGGFEYNKNDESVWVAFQCRKELDMYRDGFFPLYVYNTASLVLDTKESKILKEPDDNKLLSKKDSKKKPKKMYASVLNEIKVVYVLNNCVDYTML